MSADLYERTMKCIRCGFCLEACPTYVLTGQETESPRGRIYLVRSAIENQLAWSEEVQTHLDSCLGCRACEPACPSGVQYGSILEMARENLEQRKLRPWIERFARKNVLRTLTNPSRLTLQTKLARALGVKRLPTLLSKWISHAPVEAEIPTPEKGAWPLTRYPVPTRPVYFLLGCAMRALFSRTNAATIDLLRRHGCKVITPRASGCCGALATHVGYAELGRELAKKLIDSMPENFPVITNSAGCGSAMKEYGHFLAGDAKYAHKAADFSRRVKDIVEYLHEIGFTPPPVSKPKRVAYHDACHLAHGQNIRSQPRELLRAIPNLELIEIEESDRCCGSAGIYNLTQPKLARELLERKWRSIEHANPDIVATGNPGCLAWIRQAAKERNSPIQVEHTAVVLAESYTGT